MALSKAGKSILQVLVDLIHSGKVIPKNPETFIGYKEVHDQLGLEMRAQAYGRSLEYQGLSELAEWTKQKELPAITGLIVDVERRMPGPGYFKLYKRENEDFRWWQNEIAKSIEFDWRPYLDSPSMPKQSVLEQQNVEKPVLLSQITSVAILPENESHDPVRVSVISSQIVRDSELARKIKLWLNLDCKEQSVLKILR